MDSMCYVNEIYNKTHCTPYEIVSCYVNLKDGL